MPHQIQQQLDVWLEIMILQKYAGVDSLHYPVNESRPGLIKPREAETRLEKLIRRTCKKFDLAYHEEESESPKKRFNDWHQEMLIMFCTRTYGEMLCSFCPMSLGLEKMIELGGAAPCSLLSEAKLFSFEPRGCIILSTGYWQERFLIQHIAMQHGHQKVADFIELKTHFSK